MLLPAQIGYDLPGIPILITKFQMTSSARHRSLSLSTRALILALTAGGTGIAVSIVMGSVCFDIVKAIRSQNDIAMKMSMVDRIMDEQGAKLEKSILYKIKASKEQPYTAPYKTSAAIKKLAHLSSGDAELLKTLKEMDAIQEKFQSDSAKWVEAEEIFTHGDETVEAYRQSSVLWSELLELLKTRANTTAKAVSEKATGATVLILILITSNFVLSVLLLRYFSKYVSDRLQVILDSAAALASNQPIEEMLENDDELKRLESSLLELSSELEFSRTRKQEFLAMVSHDLRSPLTMLSVSLEMLHEGIYGKPDEELKTEIRSQLKNIQGLIRFISDLLDLEKIESGLLQLDFKEQDLIELLESIKKSLSAEATRESSVIELLTEEKSITGYWDKERLQGALERILTACLKSASGILRIKVEKALPRSGINLTIESSTGNMQLVAPDAVFDRFSQDSENIKELFIGERQSLNLARELIRLNGGEIEFSSLPGLIRFAIYLPMNLSRISKESEADEGGEEHG